MKKFILGLIFLFILYILGVIFLGFPWFKPPVTPDSGLESLQLIEVSVTPTTVSTPTSPSNPGVIMTAKLKIPSPVLQKDIADGKNRIKLQFLVTDQASLRYMFLLERPQSITHISDDIYVYQGSTANYGPNQLRAEDVAYWTAPGHTYQVTAYFQDQEGVTLSPLGN